MGCGGRGVVGVGSVRAKQKGEGPILLFGRWSGRCHGVIGCEEGDAERLEGGV